MTDSGAMRHVVTFLTRTRTRNETGEYVDSWNAVGSRRAELVAREGNETVTANQVVARVPTQFRIRFPRALKVSPAMRLKHREDLYEITSAVDEDGLRVDMLITCQLREGEVAP